MNRETFSIKAPTLTQALGKMTNELIGTWRDSTWRDSTWETCTQEVRINKKNGEWVATAYLKKVTP